MKPFIIVILLCAYSITGYSLTYQEEREFKTEVAEMGRLKKSVAVALSAAGLVVSCPTGGALSGISAVLDSVPFVSALQGMLSLSLAEDQYRPRGRKTGVGYEVLGGLPAIVADVASAGLDITDLELDDPFFGEMRYAYAETALVAEQAFGESGYCIDQWDQLGILLGLK